MKRGSTQYIQQLSQSVICGLGGVTKQDTRGFFVPLTPIFEKMKSTALPFAESYDRLETAHANLEAAKKARSNAPSGIAALFQKDSIQALEKSVTDHEHYVAELNKWWSGLYEKAVASLFTEESFHLFHGAMLPMASELLNRFSKKHRETGTESSDLPFFALICRLLFDSARGSLLCLHYGRNVDIFGGEVNPDVSKMYIAIHKVHLAQHNFLGGPAQIHIRHTVDAIDLAIASAPSDGRAELEAGREQLLHQMTNGYNWDTERNDCLCPEETPDNHDTRQLKANGFPDPSMMEALGPIYMFIVFRYYYLMLDQTAPEPIG